MAILVYLAAFSIPACLLYQLGPQRWYWHVMAALVGSGMGFIPIPLAVQGAGFDLVCGFMFVFLLTWGIGGLIVSRPHRHKLA